MLKVYKVHNYVSIDGADWREVNDGWITSEAELETESKILNDVKFDEVLGYLFFCNLCGVSSNSTLFRKKPIIQVCYKDAFDMVEYRHFDRMSYKREFKEWHDVTIDWVIKNLPVIEAIQYLKERGITTCPIMK